MKKIIITLTWGVLSICCLKAQTSSILMGSDFVPQRNYLNPAYFLPNKTVVVMLPGINAVYNANGSIQDFIFFDKEKKATTVNLNKFMDNLKDGNHIAADIDINLFGFGFRMLRQKNLFATFGMEERTRILSGFPDELRTLLYKGNANYVGAGNPLVMDDADFLHATSFMQWAVGVGYEPVPGLSVGVRAKHLRGILDISTANTYMKLTTADDYSNLSAELYYQVRTCMPFMRDTSGYQFNKIKAAKGNTGWAFDIGAEYKVGKWDFSASVLDIGGKINWKKEIYMITPAGKDTSHFSFSGIDISGYFDDDDTVSSNGGLRDSLRTFLATDTTNGQVANPYETKLPTRFNLAVSYQVLPKLKLAASFHGEMDKTLQTHPGCKNETLFFYNATLMANYKVKNWLELSLGNTVVSYGSGTRAFNLSYGATLNVAQTLQFYVLIDHLAHTHFLEAKHANVYYGLNLMMGRGKPAAEASAVGDILRYQL